MDHIKNFAKYYFSSICFIFFILASPLTAGEQQSKIDSLNSEYNNAFNSKNYLKAVEIAKQINEIAEEQHVENLYNMVRIECLLGNKQQAYRWLHRAVDSGFWDVKRMKEDTTLALINKDEYFSYLTRSVWANGYLYMLERDEREDFQMKDQILEKMELGPGMRVADVGAGSGYFTIPVAQAVGPYGNVLATDLFDQMLNYIDRRLKVNELKNVTLQKVERDDPGLPAKSFDLILMVDVYHYIKDRTGYGEKLINGLAEGGRLIVIDYIPKPFEERPWGPSPDQQVSAEIMTQDLEKAGFKFYKKYDFLPEQYFLIYKRAN